MGTMKELRACAGCDIGMSRNKPLRRFVLSSQMFREKLDHYPWQIVAPLPLSHIAYQHFASYKLS